MRSPGQTFIGFKCDPKFEAEIKRAKGRAPMSQFIRDALVKYLRGLGIEVPEDLAIAPSREGVGGGRTRAESIALRETPAQYGGKKKAGSESGAPSPAPKKPKRKPRKP